MGAVGECQPRPFMLMRLSRGRNSRDDFDLQHELRPREPHNLHQRACRRRLAEIPGADFANGRRLVHLRDVGIHLDDVRECRTGCRQRRLKILEYLFGLRLHVAGADDVAVLVEGDLAGDVHNLRRPADFDNVRVTRWLRERGGIRSLHLRSALLCKRNCWKQDEKNGDGISHCSLPTYLTYLTYPTRPTYPPLPPLLPVPPVLPALGGGAGRYSTITLLTTAIGRPDCE